MRALAKRERARQKKSAARMEVADMAKLAARLYVISSNARSCGGLPSIYRIIAGIYHL